MKFNSKKVLKNISNAKALKIINLFSTLVPSSCLSLKGGYN
jgi:hypothetical protein